MRISYASPFFGVRPPISPQNMKKVEIVEPSPEIFALQERMLTEIRSLLPDASVEFVGASAVPMVGRRGIDVIVISKDIQRNTGLLVDGGFSRGPIEHGISYLKKYVNDIEVGVQVMSPENKMVSTHRGIIRTLREHEALRKQYEDFKRTLSGLSTNEYKKKKSEWIEKYILPEIN